MKQSLLLIITNILLITSLSGQCFPNRHNTSPDTKWMSCTELQSPNSVRGVSHWLQLSLDEYKAVGNIYLWNIADPNHLTDGANFIAIDVSLDGVTWTEATTLILGQGDDNGIYEGEEVANLNGISAKYILITALTNHGGTCYGLSEIKIETVNFPCAGDNLFIDNDPILSGVYAADISVQCIGVVNSEVYLYGNEEVTLLPGFTTSPGSTLSVENNPCNN